MTVLERKASTGMAMWTVAEIRDSCRRTEGSSLIITSRISSVQIRSELVHVLAHLDTKPNSKHLIISIWGTKIKEVIHSCSLIYFLFQNTLVFHFTMVLFLEVTLDLSHFLRWIFYMTLSPFKKSCPF